MDVVSGKLVSHIDSVYGEPTVGQTGVVIGIVWNSTQHHQIEYKLVFVWDQEAAPESLKALEVDIRRMIESVHWSGSRLNWNVIMFGSSLIVAFISIAFVMVVHSICCRRKKASAKEQDDAKEPMLAFKV